MANRRRNEAIFCEFEGRRTEEMDVVVRERDDLELLNTTHVTNFTYAFASCRILRVRRRRTSET